MSRSDYNDGEALAAAGSIVVFLVLVAVWFLYRHQPVGEDCEENHGANTCEALSMCNWAEDPFYCRARVLSEAP